MACNGTIIFEDTKFSILRLKTNVLWLSTNETDFAAERTWTRDEYGAEFWHVAVRASIETDLNGRQRIAEMQADVRHVQNKFCNPMDSGSVIDSDFTLHKDSTDILVEGSALAVRGKGKVDVRLTELGKVKRIEDLMVNISAEFSSDVAALIDAKIKNQSRPDGH